MYDKRATQAHPDMTPVHTETMLSVALDWRGFLARVNPRRSRIARGIAASYVNTAVGIVCNLVLVPLYLRALGRDEYGLWMAVSGLVAYLTLLNLGMAQTISIQFARAVARKELPQASRVLATGFWTYAGFAAVALTLLLAIGPWLPWDIFVKGGPGLEQQITIVLLAAAAGFLVELPLGVFAACLSAVGRVDVQQAVAVAQNLVRVLVALAFLGTGGSLAGLILVLSLVNVLACGLQYACLRHEIPGITLRPKLWTGELARAMRRPSAHYFLLQIAAAVIFGSDTVLISSLLGTGLVAPYAIAQRAALALGVASTISLNFAPSFVETHARGDLPGLRNRFRQALAISVAAGVLASVGFAVAGPGFIRWWVGPANFVGASAFAAITGLMLVQMVLNPCDQLLVSTGRHNEYAVAAAAEAVITLVGGLLAAPVWGVAGIAWVRLLGRLVGAGPVMAWRTAALLRGK